MEFMRLVLCAIVGYLLGNIQTGLIVARASDIDLRKFGSGSSGATNALRVLGRQQAALTFLGDFLKGIVATAFGFLVTGFDGGLTGALFVVVGHIWPVFYNFRGGKGAATSIGALLLVLPWHTLLMLAVGVVVILLTKMVSLGSLAGALVLLISGVITAISRQDWFLLVIVILIVSVVIFAHRANIRRLLSGTESRIDLSSLRKKR